MKLIDIPQHIDEPPNFLFWSADEITPLFIGMVFGILTGQALTLTVFGFLITKVYRRYRDGRPDGYLLHAILISSGVS